MIVGQELVQKTSCAPFDTLSNRLKPFGMVTAGSVGQRQSRVTLRRSPLFADIPGENVVGPAESTSTFNVAFIDRSTEEPYDLIVGEFCQRAHVLVGDSALN